MGEVRGNTDTCVHSVSDCHREGVDVRLSCVNLYLFFVLSLKCITVVVLILCVGRSLNIHVTSVDSLVKERHLRSVWKIVSSAELS